MVVIIDGNQIVELQMASRACCLTRNALHEATVAEEGVSVVVDQVETWLVEDSSGVFLRNSQANGVRETLSQRSGGDLNTGSVVRLGVTRSDTVHLLRVALARIGQPFALRTYTEVFEVIEAEGVAEQM